MTTRDTETYERLGSCAEHAYDGIDVATFVSDLFKPVSTDLPPYVVLNFDQIPEPRFVEGKATGQQFEWQGKSWTALQPKWRTELSYKSRAFPFADAFIPRSAPNDRVNGLDIIRTDHRYNPFLPRRSYRWPNSYAGDVPYSYLNLYANTECTFSNRVHACVATASFGKPAMLFTRSPRAYLLKRLGLDAIRDEPVLLDPLWLAEEKESMIEFLRDILASASA